MFKKSLLLLALVGAFSLSATPDANAWVVRRVAPVRRAVLPPYPVARRVIAGPIVRRPVVYASPAPYYYGGPGVSVSVGGGYYGW